MLLPQSSLFHPPSKVTEYKGQERFPSRQVLPCSDVYQSGAIENSILSQQFSWLKATIWLDTSSLPRKFKENGGGWRGWRGSQRSGCKYVCLDLLIQLNVKKEEFELQKRSKKKKRNPPARLFLQFLWNSSFPKRQLSVRRASEFNRTNGFYRWWVQRSGENLIFSIKMVKFWFFVFFNNCWVLLKTLTIISLWI